MQQEGNNMTETEQIELETVHVSEKEPEKKSYTRWIVILAILLIASAGAGWWVLSLRYESTDDAQIEGHLNAISPRISGTVTYIDPRVEDNQFVEAGTLLVELDPRDFEADLEHAKANLNTRNAEAQSAQVLIPIVDASAFGQLHAAEAAREQAIASVDSVQSDLAAAQHRLQQDEAIFARAERDRVRYKSLVEKREISRSDYDARETEATAAAQAVEADRAAVASRQQRIAEARALVVQRQAQIDAARTAPQQVADARAKSRSASGQMDQARAGLHTAQLNLSYTKIYAPVSGVIGRKTVELGHRVQPGQSLLVIVPLDDIWITANFKETQLADARPGQRAEIYVDMYGRSFEGRLASVASATGAKLSLLPPENATGNYVKIVQRIPVKIVLENVPAGFTFRPGMNVDATLFTR